MPVTIARSPLLRTFESMREALESMFKANRPADYDHKWAWLTMDLDIRLDLFRMRDKHSVILRMFFSREPSSQLMYRIHYALYTSDLKG